MNARELTTKYLILERCVTENTTKIHDLECTVVGDGNGNKGLVRKLDALLWMLRGALVVLVPIAIKIIQDWLK